MKNVSGKRNGRVKAKGDNTVSLSDAWLENYFLRIEMVVAEFATNVQKVSKYISL